MRAADIHAVISPLRRVPISKKIIFTMGRRSGCITAKWGIALVGGASCSVCMGLWYGIRCDLRCVRENFLCGNRVLSLSPHGNDAVVFLQL